MEKYEALAATSGSLAEAVVIPTAARNGNRLRTIAALTSFQQ